MNYNGRDQAGQAEQKGFAQMGMHVIKIVKKTIEGSLNILE
jgi:hypothetical protein